MKFFNISQAARLRVQNKNVRNILLLLNATRRQSLSRLSWLFCKNVLCSMIVYILDSDLDIWLPKEVYVFLNEKLLEELRYFLKMGVHL